MSQKHMSKKELNEDPFFEEVAHIIDFLRKHQTLFITILVVLIVAFGAFFWGKAVINQQNMKASGNFGIALDFYNKDLFVEAEDQFLLVAEQYKKTDWGKRANYYLALISQNLQKPELETLEYLEAFIASGVEDAALKASAFQLMGTYYYRNGDMLSAGENYFKAAKNALGQSEKVNLGLRAGDAFIDAGAGKELNVLIKYLASLNLSEADEMRVEVLTKR